MEPFTMAQEFPLLKIKQWETRYPNLVAGFTTRAGGQSKKPFDNMNCALHVGDQYEDVIENRKQLCIHLGFDFKKWTCAEQIHGNGVTVIGPRDAGKGMTDVNDSVRGIDGFITSEEGILLTSFYADCVPLFFLSGSQKIIGIAHAGWRGTAANIALKMVDLFVQQFQSSPDSIEVVIGPSISKCCYEVNDPVVRAMEDVLHKESSTFANKQDNGNYLIDLKKINQMLLIQAGIKAENIFISDWCTGCRTDVFYSHRCEGGKTGRMTAYIGWRKEG